MTIEIRLVLFVLAVLFAAASLAGGIVSLAIASGRQHDDRSGASSVGVLALILCAILTIASFALGGAFGGGDPKPSWERWDSPYDL